MRMPLRIRNKNVTTLLVPRGRCVIGSVDENVRIYRNSQDRRIEQLRRETRPLGGQRTACVVVPPWFDVDVSQAQGLKRIVAEKGASVRIYQET